MGRRSSTFGRPSFSQFLTVFLCAPNNFAASSTVAAMDLHAPRIEPPQPVEPALIRARTSATRHAVIRGPSFTGFGYRPDLTPAHHVDLLTGIGPFGPMMDVKRMRPDVGRPMNAASS
jgi:hypothetical protein